MSNPTTSSRRRFIAGAGLAGTAIAIGPALLPLRELLASAGAQTAADAPPPTGPQLMMFAHSLEQAATTFYGNLLAGGKVADPAVRQHLTTFADHHRQHADSLEKLRGDQPTPGPNPRLTQTLADQLHNAASPSEAVRVAFNLENGLADAYLQLLGSINADTKAGTDPDTAKRLTQVGAILPAESQHAVVLGNAIGMSIGSPTATGRTPDQIGQVPSFETVENAVTIEEFPIVIPAKKA
jgi:hypothetical protein